MIGLTGYAGSGKSTAALGLISIGYSRAKFAGPLKNMLRSLLKDQGADAELQDRMIEGDLKHVPSDMLGGRTPRLAMQTLGTEWGRACLSNSLWVDAAIRAVMPYTVFDDVRFPNEVDAIRSRGGIIIRIDRPGVGPASDHESERLVGYDHLVVNGGDSIDLYRAVWALAKGRKNG